MNTLEKLKIFGALFVLSLFGCHKSPSAAVQTDPSLEHEEKDYRALFLSDIHFDPFFDPSLMDSLVKSDPSDWKSIFERSALTQLSPYRSDTNYPLLKSA